MPAIVRIKPNELKEHLEILDPEARRWRFGYSLSDDAVKMYTNNIPETDMLLGIYESITSNRVVATIHVAIDQDNRSAEVGISTLKEFRRKGLAERLLRYTVDILRNRNIQQMYSVCLPDNLPLLKLVQKLNITSITTSESDKQACINIPMAGLDSFCGELQNERMIIIDKSMKPWAELWNNLLKKNARPQADYYTHLSNL
jgi:GNAT superfamily N-acetyltransferase